jgi:hypothetical protein
VRSLEGAALRLEDEEELKRKGCHISIFGFTPNAAHEASSSELNDGRVVEFHPA